MIKDVGPLKAKLAVADQSYKFWNRTVFVI